MTHKERILATLKGEATDRTPVALWRHFPHHDASAAGLAEQVIAFQQRYDFDLVKVTPVAGYPAEAWGAQMYYLDNDHGTRGYTQRPVNGAGDWQTLPPLDVHQGLLGRELEVLKKVRSSVGEDVHVLQTIFSPLTIAKNLSDTLWKSHVETAPEALHSGLNTIAQTTLDFAKASLDAGADALFFATQLASYDELTQAQYETFGVPYDLQILEAVQDASDFTLLHAHGTNVMFDLMAQYPAQVLNWHDRRTAPSLAEGLQKFKGATLGGLNEYDTLVNGTPEAVRAEALEALAQTGGRRLILGAGCVTFTNTPEANVQAVRDAVE